MSASELKNLDKNIARFKAQLANKRDKGTTETTNRGFAGTNSGFGTGTMAINQSNDRRFDDYQ
jgi:hypothetical protein